MFHTLCNYKNGVFHWSYGFQWQPAYSNNVWSNAGGHRVPRLSSFTCLFDMFYLRHKGSLGTMAIEYNDSLRLIRDRIGSFSSMAIEYYWENSRNNIV